MCVTPQSYKSQLNCRNYLFFSFLFLDFPSGWIMLTGWTWQTFLEGRSMKDTSSAQDTSQVATIWTQKSPNKYDQLCLQSPTPTRNWNVLQVQVRKQFVLPFLNNNVTLYSDIFSDIKRSLGTCNILLTAINVTFC